MTDKNHKSISEIYRIINDAEDVSKLTDDNLKYFIDHFRDLTNYLAISGPEFHIAFVHACYQHSKAMDIRNSRDRNSE